MIIHRFQNGPKSLVAGCQSFCLFFIFITCIDSITFIQYVYPSPFAIRHAASCIKRYTVVTNTLKKFVE
jgi:hypothetical protein